MTVYCPSALPADDYEFIRVNGMWYWPGQSGYLDILRKGFPEPGDKRTILAELYSPCVEDFMHGGGWGGNVPFLVSERARVVLEQSRFTGLDFAPVHIAKIATRGKQRRKVKNSEPEDAILKARKLELENAPILFAVYLTGQVDVIPDYDSGCHPNNVVSPFKLPKQRSYPDLWRPRYHNEPFSSWVFCSEKFKTVCLAQKLSNICFTTFGLFMRRFRASANKTTG